MTSICEVKVMQQPFLAIRASSLNRIKERKLTQTSVHIGRFLVAVWTVALSLCQKRLWPKFSQFFGELLLFGCIWATLLHRCFSGGSLVEIRQGIRRWHLKAIRWRLSEVFQIQESSGPAASHHVILIGSSLSRLDF